MHVSSFAYHHPVPWDTGFEPLVLPEMFTRAAERRGDAPLLYFMGRSFSYSQLLAEARCFAGHLIERGVKKGDRIGLFLPNVPVYVSAYYGAMMAGAVVVNFSPLYTVDELSAQVEDSGTSILVTVDVPALYDTAHKVLRASSLEKLAVAELASMMPRLKGVGMKLFARSQIASVDYGPDILRWNECLGKVEVDYAGPKLTPDDLALLQYTGGTTGRPKGAMLTHSNLSMNAQQVAALNPFGEPENEIFMGALPMFHVFANTALLNHAVVSGAAIAIVPRFESKQVLKTIEKHKATGFPGVPTMFQALLDHPDLASTDLSTLKVCISGGAPLPAPVREQWEKRTGSRLVEGYGLTESSGVVSANPYDGVRKPGTIGQVIPQTRVKLVDKEDPTKLVADGEPGELVVAGPQIMQGYWNRPDAAADAFVELNGERWLRTGDVAVIDKAGFISIVDRIKDMIAVGGFKVFPSEVEKIVVQHPAIREVLVLGLPDDYHGESVNAFVTVLDGVQISAEELREWANERLGKHERLMTMSIRDQLPKTMIGKLDRKALKEEILAEQAP